MPFLLISPRTMKDGRSGLPPLGPPAVLDAPPLPHIDMRFIRLRLGFGWAVVAVSDGSLMSLAKPELSSLLAKLPAAAVA